MIRSCWHNWLITRESLRRGQWKLRVKCTRCGKQQIWELDQGADAANVRWWRRTHPDSRA